MALSKLYVKNDEAFEISGTDLLGKLGYAECLTGPLVD